MTDTSWEPGDVLPGLPQADHTPPMFALKADFYPSCDTCKCECWIRWPSTMHWSPPRRDPA